MTDTAKDPLSPTARDQRNTGPNTVTEGEGTPDRLGPSDHVGQPRGYAENAVDSLEDDADEAGASERSR